MKILPVLNLSKNTQVHRAYTQCPQPYMQYLYNLSRDTVSFGSHVKNTNNQGNNDWLDTRDMNSDALLKHLGNGDYVQAYNVIKKLSDDDWEPNYILFSTSEGDYSLIGFVFEKMIEHEQSSDEYVTLLRIAKRIVAHKDFKYINDSTGEDTLFTAMSTGNTEAAIVILNSKDFQNNLEGVNFDNYIFVAEQIGLPDVLKVLNDLKAGKLQTADSGCDIPGENDQVKTVKKLKSGLCKYKLDPNDHDPKSLDEVGGMFNAKKDINEFIIKPWHKDFREKIIQNKLNRPSGFLMSGPPGCGKTYIMKAIAAQTGYPLYEINLANIGDSEAYKTQNDLKKLFEDLGKLYNLTGEPSIVMLDELDSIAMDRKNCQTDWKKDDINALLMSINNSAQRGVIVVGATNAPDSLDPAVKRSGRLDKHIQISLPDYYETKDIIEKILSGRPIASELAKNTDVLTEKLKGMAPVDISSILHNTCLNAIYEYKDAADMEDFEKMYNSLKRQTNRFGRIQIKGFQKDD